ncbi:hypothetical protein HCN51_51245 [Nonomuraea sp. FMUSA5-5]|uniref:Uncharacterized protein n=1 Tax=Nonomuraea composti TaxID=2720023 RepID=A0ABX1BRA7_9ACTN|nr:hypothetical protein [Nonomuraea sp. FMUSA5-5]NJP97713.1 hypothetical protein [Nonomuraea sp. FMUSA5-5]
MDEVDERGAAIEGEPVDLRERAAMTSVTITSLQKPRKPRQNEPRSTFIR